MAQAPSHLTVSESPNGVTRVVFTTRNILDETMIHQIGEEVMGLVVASQNPKLLISFKGVEHLSSTALGMLISIKNKVGAKGGQLRLADIDPKIHEVFRITRLDTLFQIHANEASAQRVSADEPFHSAAPMTNPIPNPMHQSWDIPSTLPVVRDLVEEVAQRLEAAGWSADAVFAVRMGLDEAVANAVKHGNRGDATKRVGVDMFLRADRVEIRIRDQGSGFNPDSLPDPTGADCIERTHGRGVMLMHVYMNDVRYSEKGNEVFMMRNRDHGPEKK